MGIPNASVFLSNATIGAKTTQEGAFILNAVKSGKYELVVSVIGFATYKQTINITEGNILLPDIALSPIIYALEEVTIKQSSDPNRARYLSVFKEQFLGKSELANQCKILNPEILDFVYDDNTETLTASSADFLIIENNGLGYRIRYLITNFTYSDKDLSAKKLHYEGYILFEELNGKQSEEKDWQRARLQVYKGSALHFLRSLQSKHLDAEGFRVLQIVNPQRGEKAKSKISPILLNFSLSENEIMSKTDQSGVYALGCDFDSFHITYNEDHRFSKRGQMNIIDNPANRDITILNFNTPYALFDHNGAWLDPNSISYRGAWGNGRVAELLPVDYIPPVIQSNANKGGLTNIVNKLKDYKSEHIVEKAYLHFDKPYYAAGDTIYFKAYVTVGDRHELSDISGVLHAELINAYSKIDQSINLQIKDGVAWGDFALPDTLPGGHYRIRAYTRWMQNQDDYGYFDQEIKIGPINNKITESATEALPPVTANKIDLQFFAESGNMITGVSSKIAFKAVGVNGKGVSVRGIIIDNDNKEVTTFASSHLGMGFFYIKPEPGKNYKAEINYADGTKNTINLPEVRENGINLSINNSEIPRAVVKIGASDAFYRQHKGEELPLLIYSGGTIATIACKLDSQQIVLDILKRRLKTGIAAITLFSADNEPLCERLIFIQNYDQLSLNVKSDKTNYKKRERAGIRINVKNRAGDPAIGHFSVSVIDENKVPVNESAEHTILTSLLLTSDLKGTVEQPNYYFININDETQSNLDLVMLTNGYRQFEWKPLLNDSYPPMAFRPEQGLSISGNAKTLWGKTLSSGTVSLVSSAPGAQLLSVPVGGDGSFKFSDLLFTDSGKFILQAVNGKGANTTVLTYKKEEAPVVMPLNGNTQLDVNLSMSRYLENNRLKFDDYLKYNKVKMLKQVNIKAVKRNDNYRSSALGGPGNADLVIHMAQLPVTGSLSTTISSKLRGPYARNIMRGSFKGLVILDGVPFSDMDLINVYDVETVELFYGPSAAIYGVRGGGGVVVVTTKAGGGLSSKDISSTGILPITVPGFYKARLFYSPKYESLEQTGNRPDLRSTIYWQPELTTDKDGDASFNYFNADGEGSYKVVIEGIDENGNLGRQVYRYNVQ